MDTRYCINKVPEGRAGLQCKVQMIQKGRSRLGRGGHAPGALSLWAKAVMVALFT